MTIMGLREQGTLRDVHGAGKVQLQELFWTTPTNV